MIKLYPAFILRDTAVLRRAVCYQALQKFLMQLVVHTKAHSCLKFPLLKVTISPCVLVRLVNNFYPIRTVKHL